MSTTLLIIITLITLVVILGSVYLEMRRQIKPGIKVYFPDGSTQVRYRAKEEVPMSIHIQNKGRFGFPKPAATKIGIFIYAPTTFLLKELRGGEDRDTEIVKAPSGGIFGGMHYLGIEETFILFHKEEEVITVDMQMPQDTGKYSIKVTILSEQGDLGIHQLDIVVY